MKTIFGALPAAVLLTGCVSLSDSQMARFDAMSCGQLAVAFEYEDDGAKKAGTSALLNSLESISSKGKARSRADLDALTDQFEEDEHREAKKYIRQRQEYLSC